VLFLEPSNIVNRIVADIGLYQLFPTLFQFAPIEHMLLLIDAKGVCSFNDHCLNVLANEKIRYATRSRNSDSGYNLMLCI
jgi:hypothetical protein